MELNQGMKKNHDTSKAHHVNMNQIMYFNTQLKFAQVFMQMLSSPSEKNDILTLKYIYSMNVRMLYQNVKFNKNVVLVLRGSFHNINGYICYYIFLVHNHNSSFFLTNFIEY